MIQRNTEDKRIDTTIPKNGFQTSVQFGVGGNTSF
jgi:hypothetical protein